MLCVNCCYHIHYAFVFDVAADITSSFQSWGLVSVNGTKMTCKVPRLVKGKEYLFRVSAENKYGLSKALESTPEIAKHAFGKRAFTLKS